MDLEDSYLTREGYEKLVQQLDFLKTSKRREITKEIEKARAFGDLSENAEYEAARDAQAHNEQKIAELEGKLAQAKIIDNENITTNEVLIGATVLIEDLESGEQLEYTLVSGMEADYEQGKIAVSSPVGRGLLNHKLGDEVDIKIPAGTLKYKVLKISR